MAILAIALFLFISPAQARPQIDFPISSCTIRHVDKHYELGEIINEVDVITTTRTLPTGSGDCSNEHLKIYRKGARAIVDATDSLRGQVNATGAYPIRCATIAGGSRFDFVLIESSLSPIAEDIANKSVFQIYRVRRSKNERKELYAAFFDKKDFDDSRKIEGICSRGNSPPDQILIRKCYKLGCDFEEIRLNFKTGEIEKNFVKGGWGD